MSALLNLDEYTAYIDPERADFASALTLPFSRGVSSTPLFGICGIAKIKEFYTRLSLIWCLWVLATDLVITLICCGR